MFVELNGILGGEQASGGRDSVTVVMTFKEVQENHKIKSSRAGLGPTRKSQILGSKSLPFYEGE